MTTFSQDGDALEVRHQHEILRVQPWGTDSARVRAAQGGLPQSDVGALRERPANSAATAVTVAADRGTLVSGDLTVEVTKPVVWEGSLPPEIRFLRTSTGMELLAEQREHFWWPGARVYYGNRAGSAEIHQQFRAYPGERLYGMGQRTHGRLNHKGLALDLVQRNAEVSIPFVLSDRGYGLLWNNPAVGRVEFAGNATRWTAAQARAIDYYVTTGSPAQILSHYADATGHAPGCPNGPAGSGSASCATAARRNCSGSTRAPAPRTAAIGDRHRLLPLDRDGRLPVRSGRVPRPEGDDARARRDGRAPDGVDLAYCRPMQRELRGHARRGPAGRQRPGR
jgi:alpha-D-xyloside xylohydrolase